MIAAVEAIPLEYAEPNDFDAIRRVVLARIVDSSGAVGWGEAVTTWEEATRATTTVVEGLGELLLGNDAADVEQLWDMLRSRTAWYGRGGIASLAISALDMALWDLKGKLAGAPLSELLGGAVLERIPVIASAHAVKSDIAEMADEVGGWIASGFQGYKFALGTRGEADLGRDAQRDLAFLAAVRAQIGELPIMVDAVWGYGIAWDVSTRFAGSTTWASSECGGSRNR
jgi:L-alanine-DL-glutamate epimerase-like enolase superfamily enzyme